MQLVCSKCSRILEFSGQRPSFCAYCGHPTSVIRGQTAGSSDPNAATINLAGDGSRAAASTPTTVGGYRLLRELGAGGMGTVFEAEEIASGRHVAVKLIASVFADPGDAVERFRQEGRIASMISHPRCVFVLAVEEEAGQPYIVMELMPGKTLKELVEERGPLPPGEAIAKILDVIDGLAEAHRLGFIHRDVKPSNCFLEADGRVKVGDFGLAKALTKDGHLTKTGAFVGTPYFAAPEQVRAEAVDQQADVYSVAATLYYLLTGRPPIQGPDMAATLARILSDTPPSLCQLRPELPASLDRVVLRGLERDRERRWPDLKAFQQALLSLSPRRLDLGELGFRLVAGALDLTLLWLAALAITAGFGPLLAPDSPRHEALVQVCLHATALVLILLYFTIAERTWGCSLGKGIFRLRVCGTRWVDPPEWRAVVLRSGVFGALLLILPLAAALLLLGQSFRGERDASWLNPVLGWGWLVGLLSLAVTMRADNGYRGLHEILSGTRTVRLPLPQPRPVLLGGGWMLSFLAGRRPGHGVPTLASLPERIGRFTIRGALKWTPDEKVLLGEDAALGRRVFLWLRPQARPPLDAARRDVGRRTRLRWLACGKQGDLQWDAILAPSGCPLPEYVRSEGALDWCEARPLLAALAGELSAACADGTLPGPLTPAQVWVQEDSHVQLADTPLVADVAGATPDKPAADAERALELLRQVAVLALQGEPLRPGAALPTWAGLPPGAQVALRRLFGSGPRYETPEQFQAALLDPLAG